MALYQVIDKGFHSLNITSNEAVLRKCEEICNKYDMSPDDFMDQWLAYTTSHLRGAPPSLENLDQMERKELQKHKKNTQNVTPTVIIDSPVIERNVQKEEVKEVSSQSFFERTDSRSVKSSFGLINPDTFKQSGSDVFLIQIQNEEIVNDKCLKESLQARRDAISFNTRWIAKSISAYHKLELSEKPLKQNHGEMVVYGRLYSNYPGKLRIKSITLESGSVADEGEIVNLNIDTLNKYSVFNGQVVVMKGINFKTHFSVSEIFSDTPLPLPNKIVNIEENLQIVVAAGPYTMSDNLFYEPLEALIKYVEEFKPNLLILMGPFLEENHTLLEKMNEDYDSFFESMVDGIVERIKGFGTKLILIPSEKDIHSYTVLPSLQFTLEKEYENVICAPNPFFIDVNGLILGGITTDVLFHVNNAEVSKNIYQIGFDKISHLIRILFNQRCIYPLHPPDPEVRINYELLKKYAMIKELPDLLFLPSNFANFVKNVDGCVVVNPERLIKGQSGGNFARIEIRPGDGAVSDRISCQILRI